MYRSIEVSQEVRVRCRVELLDFSGGADGRALRAVLPRLGASSARGPGGGVELRRDCHPGSRGVGAVLLGVERDAAEEMKAHLEASAPVGRPLAATVATDGERIDVSSHAACCPSLEKRTPPPEDACWLIVACDLIRRRTGSSSTTSSSLASSSRASPHTTSRTPPASCASRETCAAASPLCWSRRPLHPPHPPPLQSRTPVVVAGPPPLRLSTPLPPRLRRRLPRRGRRAGAPRWCLRARCDCRSCATASRARAWRRSLRQGPCCSEAGLWR